jgi:hypothetical protein
LNDISHPAKLGIPWRGYEAESTRSDRRQGPTPDTLSTEV